MSATHGGDDRTGRGDARGKSATVVSAGRAGDRVSAAAGNNRSVSAARTGDDDREPGERGAATRAWLLRGAARLVLVRYPERGPEIVATAKAGATGRGAALAEAASLAVLALRPASRRAVWLQGALLAAALAGLVALTPLALVLPFVLLALGVFDARLAAGATLFWLFRLVTADLAEGHLLRWLLMLAGFALAAHVTRLSLRRAAAL